MSRRRPAVAAAVPPGVTVAATNYIGPHLSGRDYVLLWDGDGDNATVLPLDSRRRETPGVHLRQPHKQDESVRQYEHAGSASC